MIGNGSRRMDGNQKVHQFQQHSSSSSKHGSSNASAEQKRSKFQRSGGSKHTGSWSSLVNNSGSSLNNESPSGSTSTLSGSSVTTKPTLMPANKHSCSNKSQPISSIVVSNLLAEVADVISEDERPILPGVPIRAASLRALVRICVQAFDWKGEILEELENFPRVLFLMHQWFCPSSVELASLFISHYNECSETLAPCQDITCHCHGTSGASSGTGSSSISNCCATTIWTSANVTCTLTSATNTSCSVTASSSPASTTTTRNSNGNNTHFTKDFGSSCTSSNEMTATTTTTTTKAYSSTSSSSSSSNNASSGTKARIKMMKRSSGSSNNSSSTSSSSISHLSQEEHLLLQQSHQQNQLILRCKTLRYKASVCQALRYWIKMFPLHFDVDDQLNKIVSKFSTQLEGEGQLEWANWLDLSGIPSYDWLRNNSVSKEPEAPRPNRKVSLIFNHLEPHELAHHVTYLEHKIMRRITFHDFKTYAENGTLADNPVLERSVSIFNGLSQWIQFVVLNRPTPQQRADVIAKFVHVAKKLKEIQNFNSLMGVVGSLSHSALARLSKTMECIPAEERKVLSELAALVSSSNNFRQYRRALSQSEGFRIPILGVHLKDLISLHTALPDHAENGLINFRKMTQLFLIFKELQDLQQSMPPTEANVDLLNTLKLSLDFNYSEDEIYELSLAREPRASNSISPTRGPGQHDNVNGSYEKQVQAMVDAVFRNYDSNRDGFISRDEFQALSNNFPAIDAFFVLDENRDGMISKLELERYLRNRKNAGASHNFHEQTYFKPTFCIHCSGLLWGLIKQGYKCRNCGVNAHKYCKDYMLHECKMGQLFYFPSPEPQVKRRGFRIRKKSSSQSESGSPPSPKFFNSLEQLSLSTESTEMPASSSSSAIHGYGSSASISGNVFGSSVPKSSKEQQQQQESCSRGTKGLHSHTHTTTPKGTRRFSILSSSSNSSRPCSSVPSSPKLSGLSSISIPLLSPCRTFFGHLTTSNSSNSSSPVHSIAHPQKNNNTPSSSCSRTSGSKGLATFFGSSSNSSTPTASPSRKPKSPLSLGSSKN